MIGTGVLLASTFAGFMPFAAAGSDLLAHSGNPLPGVNLSGAEFRDNARFPDASNVQYYLDLGMELFRLPVSWSRLQPSLGGPLDAAQLEEIDRIAAQVTEAGAYLALDLHSYMRHGMDPLGPDVVGSSGSGVTQQDFANLWSRLAQNYSGNDHVLFNLMNEPHGLDTALVVQNQNAAIAAIRRAGADNLVLVSANHYSGAHSFGWSDNPEHMDRIKDLGENFAFDLHQYLDSDASGTLPLCAKGSGASRLTAATEWLRTRGHRAILGEFNTGPGVDCLQELNDMLNYMEAHSDVWIGWSWWAGGGTWRGADADDPYTLDPHPMGHDIPQLYVLQQFMPGGPR